MTKEENFVDEEFIRGRISKTYESGRVDILFEEKYFFRVSYRGEEATFGLRGLRYVRKGEFDTYATENGEYSIPITFIHDFIRGQINVPESAQRELIIKSKDTVASVKDNRTAIETLEELINTSKPGNANNKPNSDETDYGCFRAIRER